MMREGFFWGDPTQYPSCLKTGCAAGVKCDSPSDCLNGLYCADGKCARKNTFSHSSVQEARHRGRAGYDESEAKREASIRKYQKEQELLHRNSSSEDDYNPPPQRSERGRHQSQRQLHRQWEDSYPVAEEGEDDEYDEPPQPRQSPRQRQDQRQQSPRQRQVQRQSQRQLQRQWEDSSSSPSEWW
jgi:hypothetical protein